jgi:hypothetical protein
VHVRPAEVRIAQADPAQVSPAEVGTTQVCPAQVIPAQVEAAQVGLLAVKLAGEWASVDARHPDGMLAQDFVEFGLSDFSLSHGSSFLAPGWGVCSGVMGPAWTD